MARLTHLPNPAGAVRYQWGLDRTGSNLLAHLHELGSPGTGPGTPYKRGLCGQVLQVNAASDAFVTIESRMHVQPSRHLRLE